ncbi:MAG: cation:proton antiporter [Candidatus Aenigmatarchaeota archaeon]
MIEPLSILMLLAVTIVLGYIGSLIFDRTRIPDIVWLLILGLLVGPVFNLIDRTIFIAVSPLLGAVALLIILFDAGLHMNFYQIIKQIPRSILLAVLGMFLTTISISLLSMLFFNFNLIEGLILGATISGTSSAVVISIVSQLKIKANIRNILNLESIITDPLIIVIVIVLIQIATASAPASIPSVLASAYSVAIVLGFIAGIVWIFVLDKIKKRPFDYMLTLAFVLLLYVVVESIGGSGAISTLIFGLVLGNSVVFSKMLRFKKIFRIDHMLEKFQTEITFFIRSFFFVYIGLIATINSTYLAYGIIFTIVIILLRFLVIKIGTIKMKLKKLELNIMKIMVPRGLAAAVLAQLPLAYGFQNGEIYINIAFIVILSTVLYTTIATRFFYKPIKKSKDLKSVE